ncbi:MAG: hypothetical protein WAN47_09550 [Nitrosotalea sp.]
MRWPKAGFSIEIKSWPVLHIKAWAVGCKFLYANDLADFVL